MKLSRSIKIYILAAVISLGTITVVKFSALAARFLIDGIHIALRFNMEEVALEAPLTKNSGPVKFLDFSVSPTWEQTPAVIRSHINEPKEATAFEKYVEDEGWFSHPDIVAFVLKYPRPDGQTVYVSRVFDVMPDQGNPAKDYMLIIIAYAVIGVTAFAIVMFLILRRIAKPVEKLMEWAKGLTPEQLQKPAPDFQFSELNKLADIIGSSLNSVQETLDREKKFLSYSSHELRTPIAVVRSNTELLNKLLDKPCTVEKQKVVLERIHRASTTMTELCETLLWLNRGDYDQLPTSTVDVSELIAQLVRELSYLHANKQVDVTVEVEPFSSRLPVTLVRVVIANLIRNAFQHTSHGYVTIKQKGDLIQIVNNSEVESEQVSLGFGLGLELSERIIQHYGWQFNVIKLSNGRDVTLQFSEEKQTA